MISISCHQLEKWRNFGSKISCASGILLKILIEKERFWKGTKRWGKKDWKDEKEEGNNSFKVWLVGSKNGKRWKAEDEIYLIARIKIRFVLEKRKKSVIKILYNANYLQERWSFGRLWGKKRDWIRNLERMENLSFYFRNMTLICWISILSFSWKFFFLNFSRQKKFFP